MMELFAKIVNDLNRELFLQISFIVDVWQGSKYVSELRVSFIVNISQWGKLVISKL